jgi:hypothetical protein
VNSFVKKIASRFPPVKRLMRYQTLWEPGHYYSAIPDQQTGMAIVSKSQLSCLPVNGINLNEESQLLLLDKLIPFMKESSFRNEEKTNQHRFFNKNGIYGYSDALILESMIRYLKPSRIVEAGSGFTSALMMDVNDKFFNGKINLEFIEPYPTRLFTLLSEQDKNRVELRLQGIQSVDLSVFRSLGENDILFIDSTHVAKTGSDLLYLFFEILPVLQSGVYIHFHDIFNNFEYLPYHFEWKGFGWNENYFLRSFLMYNNQFEVILFSSLLDSKYRDHIAARMPDYPFFTGGQFWMKKL